MRIEVAAAVLGVVAAGYVLACVGRWFRGSWFLVRMWRWLSGETHHGHPITDAGWFRRGERALTRTGHATRFWHLPRWQRAAYRSSATAAVVAVFTGLLAAPQITVYCLLGVFLASAALMVWLITRRVVGMRRRRTWLLPLHLAAHELAGIPRAIRAESWIKAELDGDGAIRRAQLELPAGWPADSKDEQRLVAIAASKLGIEAPEPSWRRAGPKPLLVLTHSQSPPDHVEYADVAEAVERAKPHEFVGGLGKKRAVVKASLTGDSPHKAINMGSGGGKSSLASFWVMQWLRRGAVAVALDYKWHSLPWLFKDEDGEYDQLPNVAYLCSPEQIHNGLCALGEELDRRNRIAQRAVTASGRMRGDVGPPIIVVAEELNYVAPELRSHWLEIRGPGDPTRSPAFKSLGALSFAGRAVRMHLILIGQMLTADVTGSRDSSVKANIGITAMARYQAPGWKTAVGDIPMPPSPSAPGRYQMVTAAGVRETQAPMPDGVLYRQLALSGEVTPCPSWMPGTRPRVLTETVPPRLPGGGSDVAVVSETVPVIGQPGCRVTLSEAVEQRIARRSLTALRKASQRPGFPERVGMRGLAAEYDAVALAEWDAAR